MNNTGKNQGNGRDVGSQARELAAGAVPGKPEKLRVLVVEDDEVNRLVIANLLQAKGMSVNTAINGQKALALLGNEAFDIVLMDISMPKIGGLSLTRQIRKNSYTKNIPVIAITAYSAQEDRERILAEGLDGYVTKPVDPEELYKLILQLTSEDSEFIDKNGLILRTDGDCEFIKEIAELFCKNALKIIDEINQSTDLQKTAELAHKLKGSAETAGAIPIAELADKIKKAAKQGDIEGIRQACSAFAPALGLYKQGLASLGIILP